MASWTVPVIHATGDVLAVTDWNGLANDATFLYQAPYVNAYASASVSVANSTDTQVPLGAVSFSAYGASVNTSTGNIAPPLTGIYFVAGVATIAATAASNTLGEIFVSGTKVAEGGSFFNPGAGNTRASVTNITIASAGDAIGLWAAQFSGSTASTVTGSLSSYLSAFFVGSQ